MLALDGRVLALTGIEPRGRRASARRAREDAQHRRALLHQLARRRPRWCRCTARRATGTWRCSPVRSRRCSVTRSWPASPSTRCRSPSPWTASTWWSGMRRNAELLDLAYDAVFSWDFDTRAIQYWNKAASELYGYSQEEAIGKDPLPLLQSEYPVPLDEHRRRAARARPLGGRAAPDHQGRPDPADQRTLGRAARRRRQAARGARDQPRHQQREARGRRAAPCARRGRAGQQREERVPLAHEPRAAHTAGRDARLQRPPGDARAARGPALRDRRHPARRRAPAQPRQRRARHRPHRGRPRDPLAAATRRPRASSRSASAWSPRPANERRRDHPHGVSQGPERVYVRADRQRLVQVLLNLLTNAIKYGARGWPRASPAPRSGTARWRST